MKSIVRVVSYLPNKEIGFIEKKVEDIMITFPAIMAIDGSTTRTGVTILRKSDGAIAVSIAFERENNEKPVQYKVRLKREVEKILKNNKNIVNVYYEEPFLGYAVAAGNLLMLRTFIEELIVENEPELDYIEHIEVSNKKWKKIFLYPDKCPSDSLLEKEMVRNKMVGYLPIMKDVTQDEIDSAAMGFAVYLANNSDRGERLESKEKVRPFKYHMEIVGAEHDDVIFAEFWEIYNGPKKVPENGIKIVEVPKRANFDKFIYQEMGNEDKVLIAKFKSDSHANIILERRIGHLAMEYDYLYGIIWRVSRKG